MHLLSLSLLACAGSGTLHIGTPGDKGDDTGLAVGEDEEQDDPVPDFSRWVGTRDIFVGDCEGRLDEEGARLDVDWEHYDLAESWCLECDGFYQVEVSPDRVCGMDVIPILYRALWYDEEGDAAIYNLDLDGNRWELEAVDEHASFDGWNLEYDYNILALGEDPWVEGRVEFPRVSP